MLMWARKRPNGFEPAGDAHIEEFDKLKNGQIYRLEVKKERDNGFHRKVFSMLRTAFDYWEPPKNTNNPYLDHLNPEKNFDKFRKELTIRAGFYDAFYNVDGSCSVEPKSISYESMDQTEFEELFNKFMEVILNSPQIVPADEHQAKLFRDLIVSYL